MTLRVFEETDQRQTVVALHGWLHAEEVAEVERVVAAHGQPVQVDLQNLVGVDGDGVRALVRLREGGARLTGASPLVALLLERATDGRPGT